MMAAAIVEQVQLRILADAWLQATAAWWERRAQVFEDAAPRMGDFHGSASREDLAARYQRCHEAARLCREHARLLQGVV